MAPWGRPLGVGKNKRGGYERQMREWEELQRFQELDSDEDGQGVGLGTGAYRGGFVGDGLQFTGFDIGSGNRGLAYDDFQHGDDYDFLDEEDDYEGRTGAERQLAMRHKEELLVQRALERIHRARLMGKTNVKLSQEELDALERRGLQPQQPQPQQPHLQQDVPISRTPVKANTKERKTSIGSASGDKGSKRTGRGFFCSPAAKPKAAKQNRKGTPSSDENTAYDNPALPPGFVVPGPGGMPTHTPLGYYTPAYGPTSSPCRRDSSTNSHSASAARRQNNTPPSSSQYIAYRPPGRYFSQPDFHRSTSSSRGSPTRSLPDDPDWVPRSRSASTANLYPDQSAYQTRHQNYPISTGSPSRSDYNRRHVSGPAEVSYSTLRRVPPSVGMTRAGAGDPAMLTRTSSGLSQQMDVDDSSSDEDDEDQGVQVEIVPDDRGGYSVRGASGGGGATISGGGGRQRRGKR